MQHDPERRRDQISISSILIFVVIVKLSVKQNILFLLNKTIKLQISYSFV